MKAKAIKKPRVKKDNKLPSQPVPEVSLKEIQENIDRYWKAIDNSIDYAEYTFNWDKYDYYIDLKIKYLKK